MVVGASAAKALLDTGSVNVTGLRGRQLEVRLPGPVTIPTRVTYHPSAVLRGATHFKRRIVADLKRVRKQQNLELEVLTEGFPLDKVISIDTEYDPNHTILTIAASGRTQARAWDVGDDLGGLAAS